MKKNISFSSDLDYVKVKKTFLFLAPEYVYYKTNIKTNAFSKELKIGEVLTPDDNLSTLSVSGGVVEGKRSNKKGEYIYKVKNNFFELKKAKKSKSFSEFLTSKSPVKNIVLNLLDVEINSNLNEEGINLEIEKLFFVLEKLESEYQLENINVLINNENADMIKNLLKSRGSFPYVKLKIIKGNYLFKYNKFVCEFLNIEETDTLIISFNDILNFYSLLNFGYSSDYKYINIIRNSTKKIYIVKTKKNVSINELINFIKIPITKEEILIKNSLLNGRVINYEYDFVSEDLNIIYITQNKTTSEESCIGCGACYKICPMNIDPAKHIRMKTKSKDCISCGLCSYICPSNIDLISAVSENE